VVIDDVELEDDGIEVLAWWRNPLNIAAIAIAIAVLSGMVGWAVGRNQATPDPNATDVGFLQDMRWHHEQAVQISLVYLGSEPATAALRGIAREIIVTQDIEIGQMVQMLRDFGKPEANETDQAMGWMHEPLPIDHMPGLATQGDLDALAAARGVEVDKVFAKLMIAHHQGGLHMAEYAAEHAGVGKVRALATSMLDGQRSEITEMQQLLARLG
jgi:uncharacterized protein (DUF305 family)